MKRLSKWVSVVLMASAMSGLSAAPVVTNRDIALVQHYLQAPSAEQHQSPQAIRKAPQAILFVSLGMPTLVLRQYLQQAHALNIPVVIRGLYDGSIHQTGERVFQILNPKHGNKIKGGVQIDPLWFRQFQIKAVPTLVVSDDGHNAQVLGNAPLKKLLSIVAQRAHAPSVRKLANHYVGGDLS